MNEAGTRRRDAGVSGAGPSSPGLPDGLLVAWYGDDFTGSSAVMEVLTLAGLPSVLFLDTPTPALLARFAHCRGMGIAGIARSMDPQWMEGHLPPVYRALAHLKAPITHYKVCSTLDSAPHVGSIGRAMELAEAHFHSTWIPLLAAAPAIHRYQLFGNLFAAVEGEGFRLDRHPTMSRHPVTPMTEADVRVHLSRQTRTPIGLIDHLAMTTGCAAARLKSEIALGRRLIALDVIDEQSLIEAGRLIWEHRGRGLFAVGSQGIEYALAAYWRSAGLIGAEPAFHRGAEVERIAVVSGSCSEVTARQIVWGANHGFEPIRLDVVSALDERAWAEALGRAVHDALSAVSAGRDPIVFTALGPEDPAVAKFWHAMQAMNADSVAVNARIGRGLGSILDSLFRETGIRRGVLAGGDTSGHGAKVLGLQALTLLAPTVPGAALFRAHSEDPLYADLEIALKGGQMGAADYFGQVKQGGAAAHEGVS
jgi:3-oxoisoapionate kinase